jgi:hypothetical protein
MLRLRTLAVFIFDGRDLRLPPNNFHMDTNQLLREEINLVRRKSYTIIFTLFLLQICSPRPCQC